MNPGVVIALTAAAVNLSMAALLFAVACAPGWRSARLFAGMALTAGLYSLLNVIYCIGDLPVTIYLAAGRLSYLTGTVQIVLWYVYAYADRDGSLRTAPRSVRLVAVSAVATGLVFAATGWLLQATVSPVTVGWAGVTYYYPLTTTWGDVYGLLLLVLPIAAILHLIRRFRRDERFLGPQIGLFAVVFLFAIEEVLVANRVLNLPSLLDVGLLLLVLPFSWQVVHRIIDDARKLKNLSGHLEAEVQRRTDERDQAQRALLAAEQDISELVASLDAIVWEADATTLEVTFVSEGATRLLGDSTVQSVRESRSWHSKVHPDDRDRVLAETREAVRSKTNASIEYRMQAEDGRVRWFRDYVHPVGDSTGSPGRVRGIIVDVTESRHAHEALLESEECFRSLFENSTVGIYRTTADGRILLANSALLSLLGYNSFEELATRNLEKEGFEPGYPRATFRQLLESQNVVKGLEATWTRRDGSALFVRESARAVRADDGSVLYYDGIVEDFTQRKRADDALRESEERFRSIADTCPVIIWYGDPDRQITFLNKQAAIFVGRDVEELFGSGWVEHVHPDDLARLDSTLTSAMSDHNSFQTEFRIRRHDGEYRSVLDTAVPRFVGDVFAGYTGIIIDITDLKRTQEQALATQKLESLGVLASGIAHDFNNMVGGILAQAELVLSDIPAESPAVDGVNSIKAIALRAAEIVRQLLAYAGKECASSEPIDLSGLVSDILPLLKLSISKQAELRINLAGDLPPLWANASQMRRIVLNLVTNASEALGQDGGIITVTTAREDSATSSAARTGTQQAAIGCVRLEVTDTGCGMSEEFRDRIFDPFFTTKFDGRGLGLAAVQGIVRSHGGTIRVVSSAGQGTRMEVLLPCTGEQPFVFPDLSEPGFPERHEITSGTVLVVEDEEVLRVATSKMLRRKGFSVFEAADGLAAVTLFRSEGSQISAVLLDLTMPGMSGKDVLEELRRIRPDVKVILTTAYSEEMVVNAVGRQHEWAFIRKPYRMADLVSLLQDVLSAAAGRDGVSAVSGSGETKPALRSIGEASGL